MVYSLGVVGACGSPACASGSWMLVLCVLFYVCVCVGVWVESMRLESIRVGKRWGMFHCELDNSYLKDTFKDCFFRQLRIFIFRNDQKMNVFALCKAWQIYNVL